MKFMLIYMMILFVGIEGFSQTVSYEQMILDDRKKTDEEFSDPEESILPENEIVHFEGLDYFDVDLSYRIEAEFVKEKGKKFEMATSTDRLPVYRSIGYLNFTIRDTQLRLYVYKNIELSKKKEYKDYLFIPFKDYTNGIESYGGGRYMDLRMPEKGKKWIIDFNKCYNPYCAYSYKYSCPIPPDENHLPIRINAGVKKFHD